MLDLTKSGTPSSTTLRAELATARRIADTLTAQRDRKAVEDYIRELERELTALQFLHN